jgi:hypothetical protein
MLKLRARYDGQKIVLDDPAPASLQPNTPVEVLVPEQREAALAEWEAFSKEFWDRPVPPGFRPVARSWRRDELYGRGKAVS